MKGTCRIYQTDAYQDKSRIPTNRRVLRSDTRKLCLLWISASAHSLAQRQTQSLEMSDSRPQGYSVRLGALLALLMVPHGQHSMYRSVTKSVTIAPSLLNETCNL